MNNFLQVIVMALLAETIWENAKAIWQEGKVNIDRIGALIVSIIVSISAQLDIFEILEFKIVVPFVGSFLTGVLISRGANVIHDLLNKIQELSSKS